MILESVLPNRTSNIISNKTHNTSTAFRYHPILSKYPRHNTNASALTINELATVDRKYPKYIFPLLTGETLKSFHVPFALSCTIVRFTQNVTVIQLTAISDAVSCAATVPLMSLSEIVIISGIAAVKESLKTFARNVAYRTIRITGVIIDVNNIPLSLKNSFLFLFINANTVLINAHLLAFSL